MRCRCSADTALRRQSRLVLLGMHRRVPCVEVSKADLLVADDLAAAYALSIPVKLAQLPTMPGWIGVGVATPLPAVVVVAALVVVVDGAAGVVVAPPITPTHTLTSAHIPEQLALPEGFQATKPPREICS